MSRLVLPERHSGPYELRRLGIPGNHTGLYHRGQLIQTDEPSDFVDEPVHQARARGGRVLVSGLGLGGTVTRMLDGPDVKHLTVVETNPDRIAMLREPLEARFPNRINLVHGCIWRYRPCPGSRFTVVWHEIWMDEATTRRLAWRYLPLCDWMSSFREQVFPGQDF